VCVCAPPPGITALVAVATYDDDDYYKYDSYRTVLYSRAQPGAPGVALQRGRPGNRPSSLPVAQEAMEAYASCATGEL
jgi:hypothetical protein